MENKNFAFQTSNILIKLASEKEEYDQIWKLRYFDLILNYNKDQVNEEEIDKDIYDDVCDHLIAVDTLTNKVVGTYRLIKKSHLKDIKTFLTETEFDLSKLRYDKIIIMTDADVDGAHIRVLLLTLFYRFFKPIVEAGHVYAAQPPLFCIKHGQTIKYVLDEKERDEYLATLKPETKRDILRMKGLGEMDAEELNETTMDIEKRILRQITVEDTRAADEVFSKLMGDEVEPRRQFIEENAVFVQNLDA